MNSICDDCPKYYTNAQMQKFAKRFWAKVDRKGDSECWPWTGSKCSLGYGMMRGLNGDIRDRAHRISWKIHNGVQVPDKLCVCHSCDNPSCVNPSHLWLGTRSQNTQDMIAKGRNGARKIRQFTDTQIRYMRQLYTASIKSYYKLAKRFGVSHSTIAGIIKRKTYKDVI